MDNSSRIFCSNLGFSHENLETQDHFQVWIIVYDKCWYVVAQITRFSIMRKWCCCTYISLLYALQLMWSSFFIQKKNWNRKQAVWDCRAWIKKRQMRLQNDSGRGSRASYYTRISHFKCEKMINRLFVCNSSFFLRICKLFFYITRQTLRRGLLSSHRNTIQKKLLCLKSEKSFINKG